MMASGARKRIIVLGSTGSVGRNTLDVLGSLSHDWEVVGLAGGAQDGVLAEQANRFRPEAVGIANADRAAGLQDALCYGPRQFAGHDALVELVESVPCDCVLIAVAGADGLAPTIRAAELGRRIALANKEALVIAGSLLTELVRRTGATIIPIDSEHSAIFQAMQAGQQSEVHQVYLTASGGPFWTWSDGEMDDITVEAALRHPTWNMGPKITIDSATMMNKALEIVEAKWLFDLSPEQIRVVVHPEAVIHSMVEFCDGSLIAQLGTPDMRAPIQYALTYPNRRNGAVERLDLYEIGQLGLYRPDVERFPALRLGHEVAERGGTSATVLNAANETAVQLFRDGIIHFRDIARQTARTLRSHDYVAHPTMGELLAADRWARQEVTRCLACS